MVASVNTGSWNVANVEAPQADVNVWAVQTPIADMVRYRFTARITSVVRTQSRRIASLTLLDFLQ